MTEAVTFEHLDTPEQQEEALVKMMTAMGFEIVVVGAGEYLVPIDPEHPDFAKCTREVERARKYLARQSK